MYEEKKNVVSTFYTAGHHGDRDDDHEAAVLWLILDLPMACSFLRLRTRASSLLRSSCSAYDKTTVSKGLT